MDYISQPRGFVDKLLPLTWASSKSSRDITFTFGQVPLQKVWTFLSASVAVGLRVLLLPVFKQLGLIVLLSDSISTFFDKSMSETFIKKNSSGTV